MSRLRPYTTVLAALASLVTPGAQAREYRAATYNAGLLRILGVDAVPDVSARFEKLRKALPELVERDDLDILALQEVWSVKKHAEAFARDLRALGFEVIVPFSPEYSPAIPRLSRLRPLASGLMLAVRVTRHGQPWFRVERESFELFAQNDFIQGFARKGILTAHVTTPDGEPLTLIDIHTATIHHPNAMAEDPGLIQVNAAQLDQIVAATAAETQATGAPVLMLGDFNVGAKTSGLGYGNDNYAKLSSQLTDVFEAVHPGSADCTWCPLQNPVISAGLFKRKDSARVDQAWIRDAAQGSLRPLAAQVVLTDNLSDHYGVEVSFEPSAK